MSEPRATGDDAHLRAAIAKLGADLAAADARLREEVATEREACAQIAEGGSSRHAIAERIRMRGRP